MKNVDWNSIEARQGYLQNEKNPARATKTTNYLKQLAKTKRTKKTGNKCVTIAEQGKTLKENRDWRWGQKLENTRSGPQKMKGEHKGTKNQKWIMIKQSKASQNEFQALNFWKILSLNIQPCRRATPSYPEPGATTSPIGVSKQSGKLGVNVCSCWKRFVHPKNQLLVVFLLFMMFPFFVFFFFGGTTSSLLGKKACVQHRQETFMAEYLQVGDSFQTLNRKGDAMQWELASLGWFQHGNGGPFELHWVEVLCPNWIPSGWGGSRRGRELHGLSDFMVYDWHMKTSRYLACQLVVFNVHLKYIANMYSKYIL